MSRKKKTIQYCPECEAWRGQDDKCKECEADTVAREIPKTRGNYYFIDGIEDPLPRVTKVVDVLRKRGLEYWMKKTVAESALYDPSQSVEEAMSSIYKTRDKAGDRGSDVHKMIENIETGGSVSDDVMRSNPYMRAYDKFRKAVPYEPIEVEKVVHSGDYGYAGTADLIAEFGDGRRMLVDWKTSSGIYDEFSIQISAYKHAYEEMTGEELDGMAIVRLGDDGNFEYREVEDIFPIFRACLTIYKWREK